MTGRRGSICTRGDRVAGRGADERLLEVGVGDAFVRADEAGAELDPDRAHFEIGGDRLAAADAAGDEHRNVVADVRQDFLRQHRRRDRADVAAGLHALDHQRVDVRAHQLLGERERGGEGHQLGAARLDLLDRPARRKPAGEHDVADLMLHAGVDQLAQLRVHGDEVDAERPLRARLGLGDLGVEQARASSLRRRSRRSRRRWRWRRRGCAR